MIVRLPYEPVNVTVAERRGRGRAAQLAAGRSPAIFLALRCRRLLHPVDVPEGMHLMIFFGLLWVLSGTQRLNSR